MKNARTLSCLLSISLVLGARAFAENPLPVAPTITITAKPSPSNAFTAPQSATVVQGRQLDQARGMTFTDAIQNTPGVTAYTSGNFVSKPVIRGLTSNRVLIVNDGIRQETQQWGDEHGTQIDTLTVDRYEVLRGPNSLLYGSDALGGVIAATSKPLLYAVPGESKFGGTVRAEGYTGSRQAAGSMLFQGAQGAWGYTGHMTRRETKDYTTPLGRLPNTAAEEFNGGGRVGVTQDWGAVDVNYAHVAQRLEFADPDPTVTSFQKVEDNRVAGRVTVPTDMARFEISTSYEQNRRQEFEDENAKNSTLHLLLKSATLDFRAHHQPIGLLKGTVGLSAFQTGNSTRGEESLIPNFTHQGVGGYVYEELPVGPLTLTAGVRGDGSRMDVDESTTLGNTNEKLNYSAMTGGLGAVYHVTDPFALAFNVGRGYRSPSAFELFSNGVHEGTNRFEVGNKNLRPEKSFNIDVAARWSSERARGELTFFRNQIDDYIFSSPTGTFDAGSGLEIFNYAQGKAELIGSELSLEGDVWTWLTLTGGYDIVRGRNKSTDLNLPLMPADRLKLGVRIHGSAWTGTAIKNPYVDVNSKLVRKQSQIDPNEIQTGGYALWGIGTGFEIPVGENPLSVDFGVTNLFDKRYTDHLARNKAFAPEPGRNVFVKVSLPFGNQK